MELKLNSNLLNELEKYNKKVLVVTKYYDSNFTNKLIEKLKNYKKLIYGIGENRLETIQNKKIKNSELFFIGNLQSNKIKKLSNFTNNFMCVDNLKHVKILNKQERKINIFIQINLDKNKKNGIKEIEFENFYENCEKFENIKILGILGIGKKEFTNKEKETEIKTLISIKNKFNLKHISFGTSCDYKHTFKYREVDILRIGRKMIL
jgi:uncharacterized pyridoxal phosphate-containing UPF0001 family protein